MKVFKVIKRFWNQFALIMSGMARIIRDYVVPSIRFLNFLKELAYSEADLNKLSKDNYKSTFAEIIRVTEGYVTSLLYAFIYAMKELQPPFMQDLGGNPKHIDIIKAYATYIKTLEKHQRNMLLFKTASLMVKFMINESKMKYSIRTNDSDLLVQMAFSYNKHKTII